MSLARAVAAAACAALLASGCGEGRRGARDRTPEAAAGAFLEAAVRGDAAEAERLADAERRDADRVGFRTACEALGEILVPGPIELAPLPDGVVADFEGTLPGGGKLRGSLVLRVDGGGRWRVAAVGAPGASWPRRRPAEEDGLTVSPPPRSPSRSERSAGL